MIDIFSIKKSIVVDIFTSNSNAAKLFPIAKAMEYTPNWWKSMPNTYTETTEYGIELPRSTIKRCAGFIDLYSRGFILPMWSDIAVKTTSNTISFNYADTVSTATVHPVRQLPVGIYDKYIHLKLNSPWFVRETTGVYFQLSRPFWNIPYITNPYEILPGTVEFRNQYSTNINIFFEKNRDYIIEAGTAISHWVPITDKALKLKIHVVSEKEIEDLITPTRPHKFFSSYRDRLNRCPFHK